MSTAQSQILESQLLSGGLPVHLFAYFGAAKLSEMIRDAEIGGEINEELVAQLNLAMDSAESQAIVKTDEEKLFK